MNPHNLQLLAQIATSRTPNIKPEWVAAQWKHETNDFTSDLYLETNNLGGLTQTLPNEYPQPDGTLYYMQFNSVNHCARYFSAYLTYYIADGILNVKTLEEYIQVLKNGGYFGDSYENYLKGVKFHAEKTS